MLHKKVFVKKTRKGGVLKVAREHYLRDDIFCGVTNCSECSGGTSQLEFSPPSSSKDIISSHYLVPDTNVVLHQIDVLEDSTITNVIILQTVLEEVKHRSPPAYRRIRDITDNKEKHFYVFSNEHHRGTYITRDADESPNDRNDRAIRKATQWYQQHLEKVTDGEEITTVVLLTNDKDNKEKAQKESIHSLTLQEYVESLENHSDLLQKLSMSDADDGMNNAKSKIQFKDHLLLSEIQTGIKQKRYFQGTFFASRDNFLEASVRLSGTDEEVFLQGREHLNRSVNEDIVAVKIFPKEEWVCPSSMVLEEQSTTADDDEPVLNEGGTTKRMKTVQTGCVVGIIKRNWKPYCGVLTLIGDIKARRHMFVAANKLVPRIMIETRQAATLRGKRIVVTIDGWSKTSKYPHGHYVRLLGEVGDKDTENEVLLLEHDIPHSEFSKAVLSFLPTMPWSISKQDYKIRRDLRHLNICSIDPPGCTDIDDALHWRPLPNGNYEAGVHIADVTHFITHGTALDEEARNRGTTVYLVDKRIDMVPELLSSNLCSLRSNVERLAFSCVWELTENAEIVSVDFFKSVILSKASFTYGEAQMVIDAPDRKDELAVSLRGLNQLAKKLKLKRMEKGALTLASPEVRFNIDSETHDAIDMQAKELRETNSLVEEFMLLANISVAEKIFDHFSEFAVLRRHPQPATGNFDPLLRAAKSRDVSIDVSSGLSLSRSLDNAEFANPYMNTVLRILTTRCMTQALYFCSGSVSQSEFLHFGLAAPIYTHFTSPIRRYSDILVHRLLAVAVDAMPSYPELLQKEYVQKTCDQLNYRHRKAQYAGRSSVKLHTEIYFKSKAETMAAYIITLRKNAIQVLVPKYGLEGTVFLTDPKNSKPSVMDFDEEEYCLRSGDVCLRVLDEVTVQISIKELSNMSTAIQVLLVHPKVAGLNDVDSTGPKPKKSKTESENSQEIKNGNK